MPLGIVCLALLRSLVPVLCLARVMSQASGGIGKGGGGEFWALVRFGGGLASRLTVMCRKWGKEASSDVRLEIMQALQTPNIRQYRQLHKCGLYHHNNHFFLQPGPRHLQLVSESHTFRESFQMVSILSMISMWRGRSLPMTLTGHFSSASGMTVWLVKARVCGKDNFLSDAHTRRACSVRRPYKKSLEVEGGGVLCQLTGW